MSFEKDLLRYDKDLEKRKGKKATKIDWLEREEGRLSDQEFDQVYDEIVVRTVLTMVGGIVGIVVLVALIVALL